VKAFAKPWSEPQAEHERLARSEAGIASRSSEEEKRSMQSSSVTILVGFPVGVGGVGGVGGLGSGMTRLRSRKGSGLIVYSLHERQEIC
jgi:hypothetical protein